MGGERQHLREGAERRPDRLSTGDRTVGAALAAEVAERLVDRVRREQRGDRVDVRAAVDEAGVRRHQLGDVPFGLEHLHPPQERFHLVAHHPALPTDGGTEGRHEPGQPIRQLGAAPTST